MLPFDEPPSSDEEEDDDDEEDDELDPEWLFFCKKQNTQ